MAKVDPFVIQWPAKWMADNEIRPVVEYLNRFLHDLFIRTGGGDDLIENATEVASSGVDTSRLLANISALGKRVNCLESSEEWDGARLAALINESNKRIRDLEESKGTDAFLLAKIKALENRIEDLESIDIDSLIAKIAKLNQKVNQLIQELLTAVKANEPDRELENKAFCIQNETLKQLKLLNLMTEEGLETDLDEGDL